MERITDILFCKIETEDGRRLGHVFEIRSPGDPTNRETKTSREITEFLYGERGLLELLGFAETKLKSIAADDVKRFDADKIVVSNDVS